MELSILKTSIRFPPAIGGAESYIEKISDILYEKKYNIKIITTDLKQHIDYIKLSKNELQNFKKSYPVIRSKTYHIPHTTYPVSIQMIYQILNSNEDIFHAYCIHYFPSIITKIASQIKRKPFFCTPIFDLNNALKNKKRFNLFEKYNLKSNGVIFISEFEKRAVEMMNIKLKNYSIIPPSLDEKFLIINYDNIRKEKLDFLNKYKYKLLFVGRISFGKGIDILINAANILNDMLEDFCIIICGQNFGYVDKARYLIKKFNLKNIYIIDEINNDEIKFLYRNSDVFILPSRYEAFGIVLIEAMYFKLAVIGMNNSAIPFLIKNEETGLLFENENYTELANQIIKIINSKELKYKLIENAYNMVIEKYNWKSNIKKLIEFYNENI